jgi:hypothetical protein
MPAARPGDALDLPEKRRSLVIMTKLPRSTAFPTAFLLALLAACSSSDGGSGDTTDGGGKDDGVPCGDFAGCPDTKAPPGDTAPPPPGSGPSIGGCEIFPSTNEWNRDVSADEVDANSANYIANMNPTKALHPDWGALTDNYGIPYIVVPESQPKVPVVFEYADESDPGPYPIPADAPIEGGAGSGGDMHVLAIQQGTCMLYEMFSSTKDASGAGWHAGSGAIWNLKTGALRPEGWTSADAAGLPIFPGLARADETLELKEIKHALRFTVVNSQKAYIHPATHYASSKTDANLPPMGLRVRLKASFDISKFSAPSQVIFKALKKYGMFVADNGSDWFISGASDNKWTPAMDALVADFRGVHGSDFEVVKTGAIVK